MAYLAGVSWGKAVQPHLCQAATTLLPPAILIFILSFKQTKLTPTTGPLHCFFLCLESISPTTDFSPPFRCQLKHHLLLEASPNTLSCDLIISLKAHKKI